MNAMRTWTRRRWIAVSVLAVTAGFGGWAMTRANVLSGACPGTIVCPITGERICKDLCPLKKATASGSKAKPCCAKART